MKPTRREFLISGGSLVLAVTANKLIKIKDINQAAAQGAGKRIYLAPDDHTDYFWSGGEATYELAFLNMIDYYLDRVDDTSSDPDHEQSRWNCDGSFWMWTFEKNRSASEFQRLIDAINSGHFSVPLNALCVCLGGAPVEAVLRGMYYPGRIERQYGIQFPLAYTIENQTQPYGLVSLWAGAGAKYSWKGICGCDSRVNNAWDREHDIYWWQGPDGSMMLMKWNSMLQTNQSMGGYAETRNPLGPSGVVNYVDSNAEFRARYDYDVIGAFGQGWDDLATMNQMCVNAAISLTTVDRLVRVSNEVDFFEDFEATYPSGIPTVSASFGNEWDLYAAAIAEVSARIKRSVEKLRAAEAMATLVSLENALFMNGREQARNLAWMDLGLYWEHNLGMVNPPVDLVDERIAWQKRLAGEIESYVDTLHSDALTALGGLITKTGGEQRFFVFNPLSWLRTDFADLPFTGSQPVHVVDLNTNQETPSQMVLVDGTQYLRILAENIPSVGYKVFEVRSGAGQAFSNAASVTNGNTLNNGLVQVTVAQRGAITSLIDLTRGNREFVAGGQALNDLGSSSGTIQVENAGPVSVTLRATASNPLAHTSRITLYRNSARVDIRNDINQNFSTTQTWAYSFAFNNQEVWHEEVGAIIRAKLLADGGHYSPRNARYDWLTLNHFADMSESAIGVTLSNWDCYFMKLGNSSVNTLDTTSARISPLAGGKVANSDHGLPNQGGDTHFLQRFALQTHNAYSAPEAMRFALEHQNPLVAGDVSGGSVYPEQAFSLINISNPDILLWALKPADDGITEGIITRLWNLSSGSENLALSVSPGSILSGQEVTHIETPTATANVSGGILHGTLNGQQLKTYLLNLDVEPPELNEKAYLPFVVSPSQVQAVREKGSSGCHR